MQQGNKQHLDIVIFWQAKTYGQATHDVRCNLVHFVHEAQHSFPAGNKTLLRLEACLHLQP